MLRIKQITLCILAMFVLSAVAASAASAASPAWWVAGSLLKSGEKASLAETTTVAKAFEFKTATFDVKCETVQLEEAFIEGEKTRSEHGVVFSGCKDIEQPECEVASIKTQPLTAVLSGTTGNFKLKFKPTSGTEIATITLVGEKCTFSISAKVTGEMNCNYKEVETEAIEHRLEFTPTSGSKIEIGGSKGEFIGTDVVRLASGKNWSVQ